MSDLLLPAVRRGSTGPDLDPYYNLVSLHLKGDVNTGRNYNAFSDASSNNFRLTNNGDVRGSSFSPYGTSWSNYFSGVSDLLTFSTITLGSSFTIEFFVYFPTTPSANAVIISNNATNWVGVSNTAVALSYSAGTRSFSFTPAGGTWYYVQLINSASSLTCYVNGTQVGTAQTGPSSFALNRIAGYTNVGFTGYLSSVRLNSTALAASTTPTSPLTDVSNTVLLTCQSNRFIDNSSSPLTLTKGGSLSVSSFSPFLETDTTSGSGYYDGTGDGLAISTAQANLGFGTDNFSTEFWAYRTNANAFIVVFQLNTYNTGLYIRTESTTYNDSFYFVNNSWNWDPATNFPVNAWTHICVTRQSGWLRFFVNGKLIVSAANTSNMAAATADVGAAGYAGYLSDVRVVKGSVPVEYQTSVTTVGTQVFSPPTAPLTAAVSGTQLLTLQERGAYNTIGFQDESEYQHVITRNGNVAQGTFSPFSNAGWSGYFDGSGDYLANTTSASAGFNLSTGAFTIEAWVYLSSVASYQYVLNLVNAAGAPSGLVFGINTSGQPYIGNGAVLGKSGSTALTANTWVHLAVVSDGTNIQFYTNGQANGSAQAFNPNAAQFFYIGRDGSGGSQLAGYISNVRVIKGQALFTGAFTPSAAPLTATSVGHTGPGAAASLTPFVYATWSNGSLTLSTGSTNATASNIGKSSGKWYWEVTPTVLGGGSAASLRIGVCNTSGINADLGGSANGWCFLGDGRIFNNSVASTYGTAIGANDVLNVALDIDAGKIWYGKNGTWMASGNPATGANPSQTFTAGQTMYAAVASGIGTPTYVANFGASAFTGTVPAGFVALRDPSVSLLTCQSNRFIDNSGNNRAITKFDGAAVAPFSPFKPVAYDPAVHGGSGFFDGTGDNLAVVSPQFTLGTDNLTAECWFYPTAAGNSSTILACKISSGAGFYFVWASTSNAFRILVHAGAAWNVDASSAALNLNTWNHLVMTRDGSTIRTFLNGVLATVTTGITGSMGATAPIVRIGSDDAGSGVVNASYITGVRIVKGVVYPTSLTTTGTQVFTPPNQPAPVINNTLFLLNFTNGGVIDSTGKNIIETVGNAGVVTTTIKKYGSGSMFFDGTGDYDVIPLNKQMDFSSSGSITIEFWMYGENTSRAFVIGSNAFSSATSNYSAGIMFDWTPGVSCFFGAGRSTGLNLGAGVTANTWHHVAFCYNGATGTNYVFLNGNLITSSVSSSAMTQTAALLLGVQGSDRILPYKGYIDDLRITSGLARYVTGTGDNANKMVFNGTNTLALPTKAFPDRGTASTLTVDMAAPSSVEALVVGGGGGGGAATIGGPGGGGGIVYDAAVAVSAGSSYPISVGIGGTGNGGNGANSVGFSYTADGGGAGGYWGSATTRNAKNGGSGGAAGEYAGIGTPGTSTQNTYGGKGFGNSGGAGYASGSTIKTGGGGGAGGAGSAATSTTAGNGGAGKKYSITGIEVGYGGGGGGADYNASNHGTATDGGGAGSSTGIAGTPNTGGGGGAGLSGSGTTGGSGVVILAYPTSFRPLKASLGLVYTIDTVTRPGYRVYRFTSGSGSISW